jgi:hypothetical protein
MSWLLTLMLWIDGPTPYEMEVGLFDGQVLCELAGRAMSGGMMSVSDGITVVSFTCVDQSRPS